MMRSLFLVVTGIMFYRCTPSPVEKSFSSADSLVIHFKDEQAGVINRTVKTGRSDPGFRQAINRMIEFIDGKETKPYACGYDGKMFFFNKDKQVQEVDFKMKNDTCNHFSFMLNGKLVTTRMRQEAVDFLDALEKGMPYYY